MDARSPQRWRVNTLKDVARVSGFSMSTVSRALTGIGSVDPRTKERIASVARDLGYRPHAAARTLATSRSHVIGVIFGTLEPHRRISHPFLREVLEGMNFRAGEANYDLLLLAGHPEETPEHYVHRALSRRVDGLVLLGIDRSEIDRGGSEVRELASAGIPTIGIDVDIRAFGPWFGYVTSDNVGGACLAVRHLLELGRSRVACCTGPLDTPPGNERLVGYTQALESAGKPYREEQVVVANFTEQGGYHAMRRLLSLREIPDAVFVGGDLMAIGAMKAIFEAGIRVPEEIAIVGFDDVEAASMVRPALTTVRQNTDGLGGASVAMVADILRRREEADLHHVEPVELVVRESTTGPAARWFVPEG
ncbi:MAG: LacI family DNA-binding transcriptional regulator [Gaiellaceae bacterium]